MPASDQGTLQGRYTLIPRTLIFLTRGGRVLLMRGAAHKRLWAGRYNGLGGHVERGEDPLSAGRRELHEEAGLASADLRLVGVAIIDAGPETGVGLYILRGECLHGEPQPSREGQAEWIDPASLPDLPVVEDLPILLPRVLSYRPGDPPFSARFGYGQDGKMEIVFSD
jgi:8-oxo-dGTP diphosphatase